MRGKHIAGINSLEDFRYYIRILKSWFDGIISLFATVTPTALPKSATTRLKCFNDKCLWIRNFNRFLNCIISIFLFFVPQLLKKVWECHKRFVGIAKPKQEADIDKVSPIGILLEKWLKKVEMRGIMDL